MLQRHRQGTAGSINSYSTVLLQSDDAIVLYPAVWKSEWSFRSQDCLLVHSHKRNRARDTRFVAIFIFVQLTIV